MEKLQVTLAEDNQFGRAGQRVELALTPSDVHTPEELPTYLAGYGIPEFRADQASQVVPVDFEKGKYRTMSHPSAFQRAQVKISNQAQVPEVDPASSVADYSCVTRAVASFIPTNVEMQSKYRLRQAAAERCKRALLLDREVDVWTLLTTSGNWDSNMVEALGATANWNGGATSDPMDNLFERMEVSYQAPTDIWMNFKVARAFLKHATVRDQMRQMLGDGAATGAVDRLYTSLNNAGAGGGSFDFQIPGLPPIHVVNAKAANASGVPAFLLGDSYVVLTRRASSVPVDGTEIATTYTFGWKGPYGVGFNSREYFVENRGPYGGTMLVATMADVAIMTSNLVGGLITGAVT